MGTYYVRKTGNNGNTGATPAQAWLTIDHAANQVAAGDTVWIGAGYYRELVTMDTSGASGSQISFIGDIDGVMTGDPGPVVVSAYDALLGPPVRTMALSMGQKQFITWQYVVFEGGTAAAVGETGDPATAASYEGVKFIDCVILQSGVKADFAWKVFFNAGVTPTGADGFQMTRCITFGHALFLHANNAVAHIDLKITIENCVFWGDEGAYNLEFYGGAAGNTYSVGGVDIVNCLFMNGNYVVYGTRLHDTSNQLRVLNCTFIGGSFGIYEVNCTTNAMYEDYNLAYCLTGLRQGDVQAGGNSDSDISAPKLGWMLGAMFQSALGWVPWKALEPPTRVDGTALGPQHDFASAAYAPATDVYNNPRPMGRNTDDAGPAEARARLEKETTTTYGGSAASARFEGAGYHDMIVPVAAVATTVTVQARYDGNYTGSLPILEVLNIPGVANQSDVVTAAANTWEQLSCAFTPTSAGYVRVRLRSRDTSANGKCFFDAVAVS